MRALSERDDQCQAKLDIMVDAFSATTGPRIATPLHGCATSPIRKISNAAA